jgi:hypothetical protein
MSAALADHGRPPAALARGLGNEFTARLVIPRARP